MQSEVDDVITWSGANVMNINTRETKEMVLGLLSCNLPSQIVIGDLTVEMKLKWNDRVAYICYKMNKHLHFLKQLKRAGM